MIRCPQCGTDNLDGSEYCDECGYQLSAMRGAPTSGALLQGGIPSAPPQATPPAAVHPRNQVSYGAGSRPAGPEPKMTPSGLAPADFLPPPPNVPSIAVAPQPYPAASATPPAADVFAVAPPLFSAGAGTPVPPAPPAPPPIPSPPAMSAPPAPLPVEQTSLPVPSVPAATGAAPPSPHTVHTPSSPSAPPPAAPSVPRAKLVIQRGGTVGKEFLLTETESNIGRWDADGGIFPDVDLDQDDPEAKVSRRHARIVCQDGQYVLEDLGSTNGTFVNRGRRLLPGNRHPLNDGDEIIVGKTFLKFHYIR